jgi:hypothetical protein
MKKTKIDYQSEYKKQLKINISLVRSEIDNPDFVLKIKNHAEKFNREPSEIREKIMTDDMYAEIFAKDPSKQNIYEKLAADYISKLKYISDFKNLPNNAKIFVCDGVIVNKRQNDVKSIDFYFKVGNKNIYVSHKYIKATYGGAQDNQYNDVRNFLKNCNKINSGDDYFISICDGPYFESKIKILNNDFGSKNVIAMGIDDLEGFIEKIAKDN